MTWKIFTQPISLLNLSALFEVSIAFGLAYLAFDRFRFNNRIISLIQDYSEMGRILLDRISEQTKSEINRDSYFQKLDTLMVEHSAGELGPQWFKDVYGNGIVSGYDKKIVTLLVVVNIVLLTISGLFMLQVPFFEYVILIAVPLIGIAWPSYLTYHINSKIKLLRLTLEFEYELLQKTYGFGEEKDEKGITGSEDEKKYDEIKLTMLKDIIVNIHDYMEHPEKRQFFKAILVELAKDVTMRKLITKHPIINIIKKDQELKNILEGFDN